MLRQPIVTLSERLKGIRWRWHLTFLLLLSVLTAMLFIGYLHGPLPTGTDSQGLVMTSEMAIANGGLFSSWEPYSALGFQNDPTLMSGALSGAASWLGLSTDSLCKLIMAGSFWLAGAFMYLCAFVVSRNSLGSACAAIVFCFNQIFLSQIMEGHYYFVIGFALLPLVFLILYRAMFHEDRRAIVLLPVSFFIYGSIAAPHMVLILAITILVFTGLYLILNRTYLRRAPYPIIGLFLLVLPTALSRFSSGTGLYNASYSINEAQFWSNKDIWSALATQSTENSHFRGGTIQSWVIIDGLSEVIALLALLIPIVAFLSLYFKENRKLKLILAGTAIVLLFFAMGPNQWLLSDLFIWMFRNLPLLDSIRVFSRFGMFLGLIYALLIALLISDLRSRSPFRLTVPAVPSLRIARPDRVVVTAVVVVMVVASSSIFIQGPDSYTLPASYMEPFEVISTQGGDYRILTLPYGEVYYSNELPKYDGYPATLTNDPGTYSQLFTGKEVAYGDHAEEFWSVWGTAVDEHSYGYRDLPILLGYTSSVRYVVSQVHAPSTEKNDYLNMTGLVIYESLPNGSMILENSYYEARVHGATELVLTTGGRAATLTSLASGAVDLRTDEIVLLGQVTDESTREVLWETSDKVIVQGGDLLDLLTELGAWDAHEQIRLGELADTSCEDSDRYWISSDSFVKDGTVLHPSAYTQGRNVLHVPITLENPGAYDIYLRARAGPGSGNLTVTVNGSEPVAVNTDSIIAREIWAEVGTFDLSAGTSEVEFANDGSGWSSLDDLLVVPHEAVERQVSEISEVLGASSKTITYVYGPQDLAAVSSPSWELREGLEGIGLALNATVAPTPLVVNTTIPRGGDWTIALSTMDSSNDTGSSLPFLVINGVQVNGTDLGNGLQVFHPYLAEGNATIEVHASNIYSLVVEGLGAEASEEPGSATVHYDRTDPWRYLVTVNTTGPLFLKMAENYSPHWTARSDDGDILHYQSSSQINGFYISEAGNYTITITFDWQERFWLNQAIIVGTTAATTALLVAILWWKGRRTKREAARQ